MMKLFVAYGYNDRDQWVKDLVIPMAQAFRFEVVTGEQTYGSGTVPQGVLRKIQTSDAVIAFTTQRDQMTNGAWTTHHWVLQEIAAAMSHGRPVVEVRALEVELQAGMQQGLQRIDYDEKNREQCLIKIVEALGALRFSAIVEVQLLLPAQALEVIGPLAKERGQLICAYTYKEGFYKSPSYPTEVEAIKGGLFITIRDVPLDALIQVRLQAAGKSWSSDYDSVTPSIHLS
jgi:hypothetical protein